MIEEMREDVAEHDEAAGDAHLPHANAAQPSHHAGRGPTAARAHVNYCGRSAMYDQLSQTGYVIVKDAIRGMVVQIVAGGPSRRQDRIAVTAAAPT